ncbi:hypothetical protein KCM76_10845 [Zooshikella marina]|uniref:hypothetical protein n=1 Tax=Zooshikella ganghwensis TaxID=202772 RepID=UPI001BAEBE14|nr:hypothetical protein [Zooshikella ganghwensis]MBU2706484.1 hypothetical protein [Zooshikella ganghwensis]
MKEIKYWTFDEQTREVRPDINFTTMRGGIAHIPVNALTNEPLTPKTGFAVVVQNDLNDYKYIEDHRGKTVYRKENCLDTHSITESGPIDTSWTEKKPKTDFDEWMLGQWVTNNKKKYEFEYKQAEAQRRSRYTKRVRPLLEEAQIKAYLGMKSEANALLESATKERMKVQQEVPLPSKPEDE